MNYTIQIEVDEDGYPRWLHDYRAEAALVGPARIAVQSLYQRYKAIQAALAEEAHEQEAQAAERLLHRSEVA